MEDMGAAVVVVADLDLSMTLLHLTIRLRMKNPATIQEQARSLQPHLHLRRLRVTNSGAVRQQAQQQERPQHTYNHRSHHGFVVVGQERPLKDQAPLRELGEQRLSGRSRRGELLRRLADVLRRRERHHRRRRFLRLGMKVLVLVGVGGDRKLGCRERRLEELS